MKVYQLVAVGHLKVTGARHIVHSKVAYETEAAAQEAIPAFKKIMTMEKKGSELMTMTDNPLRVFVDALEVL